MLIPKAYKILFANVGSISIADVPAWILTETHSPLYSLNLVIEQS